MILERIDVISPYYSLKFLIQVTRIMPEAMNGGDLAELLKNSGYNFDGMGGVNQNFVSIKILIVFGLLDAFGWMW